MNAPAVASQERDWKNSALVCKREIRLSQCVAFYKEVTVLAEQREAVNVFSLGRSRLLLLMVVLLEIGCFRILSV